MCTLRQTFFAFLMIVVPAVARSAPVEVRREIHFPNLPGSLTLVCDLHMHTVFSDGLVWPTVRVSEAWREGLDAIAITDHIEYQPHKDDLPTKHNRSYELAQVAAKAHNLLLIRAAEITRDTPPGHFNALFLDDVRPLDTPDFLDAIKQANRQGAFVFWNHHAWKGEENGRWSDLDTTMYQQKLFQGMEVCNGDEYYPQAHKWCLEKNLTMLGDSDIHEPDPRQESSSRDHRTMNLIFAKERSLEGVKEALKAGRTVVWFNEQLIGREELLRKLFHASVEVVKVASRSKTSLVVELRNNGPADIQLECPGEYRVEQFVLPARTTNLLRIARVDTRKPVEAKYTAKNFLVAPGKAMQVTLTIPGPEKKR
jgi:3',5'-nucleoside bisphosphate phosphatase